MARTPVVLGVGNPLFGDDGFGIEVIRRLRQRGVLRPDVEILDGGTAGIYLLPELENRPRAIIVDAVNFGGAPGQVVRLRNGEIPSGIGLKLSEHQVTVKEVLALLELLDSKPADVLLLGVQPGQLRFAEPLSEPVRNAIDGICAEVEREAESWNPGGNIDAVDECAIPA